MNRIETLSVGTTYSTVERIFARLLSATPGIKRIVKRMYQYINWILEKKDYQVRSDYKITKIGDETFYETFFGYYDKFPINKDGTYILYHGTDYATLNKPSPDFPVKIILQETKSNKILLTIPSFAYNWQQGSRLQWLTNELFVFNDFDIERKCYIARVWSTSRLKEVNRFDYPVQDAYGTDYFLTLNYRRLLTLRPDYGYRNLPKMTKSELMDINNDGIWKIDYATGDCIMFISLKDICSTFPDKHFDNALHKVNHILISPSGEKYIFLHRFFINKRKHDRLILIDSKTGSMTLLNDYGMISHYCWINDETILGYMRGPDNNNRYWEIDATTGEFRPITSRSLNSFGDGHPCYNGKYLITDTYPDKARMQRLLYLNKTKNSIDEIAELFHGLNYSGESRCDLHPRMTLCKNTVFFDSVYTGKRSLYSLEISHD
jgi:hypothetical protein